MQYVKLEWELNHDQGRALVNFERAVQAAPQNRWLITCFHLAPLQSVANLITRSSTLSIIAVEVLLQSAFVLKMHHIDAFVCFWYGVAKSMKSTPGINLMI